MRSACEGRPQTYKIGRFRVDGCIALAENSAIVGYFTFSQATPSRTWVVGPHVLALHVQPLAKTDLLCPGAPAPRRTGILVRDPYLATLSVCQWVIGQTIAFRQPGVSPHTLVHERCQR